MQDSSLDRNIVEVLAEEFVERYRKGERPLVSEYTERHPEHAEEIEDLFPAMLMMENLKPAEEDDAEQESSEPPLVQIGDYRILGEVGRGGMGIVYEAEQLSLGRRVAVKVLPQQMMHDKKNRRRFEREAKAAARLHHTNIVPVFGVGEQDGLYYYVMQFIQGLGLDQVLEELRRLPVNSQASMTTPHGTLSVGRTSHEVSAAHVARSLMSGQFEQTIITNLVDGPDPLAETMGYDHDREEAELKVEQRDASVTDATTDSTKAARTSSHTLSELTSGSLALSGSVSLSGHSDSSVSSSVSRARRKQTFFTSVANIGHQVASALQYAHEQGITHRDIKPSNLLLDMRNTVWVTDFGLAKANDQQDITHTGDILGTLRYMPPEAFEGQSDARGDQYSLGLTLYELLAQRPAFDESDRHKLIKLVTTGEPARIEKLNRNVPHDLATIIHKAIDRDPSHRYASAGELADDLERFMEDEPIKARRLSLWERSVRWSRRNRGLAVALGVVTALLLVINIAGPLMTLRMASLNSNLQTSQRDLSATVHNLTVTKGDLEQTVATLESTQADLVVARDEAEGRAEELQLQAIELAREQERAEGNLYAARIALAENHLNIADAVNAGRSLTAAIPTDGATDRRGWEWHYLDHWRDSSERTFRGHSANYVFDVACSPDGRWLASAGGGNPYYATGGGAARAGEVLLRDFATGDIVHRLEGHTNIVSTIAFSPDGEMLATAGQDHQIILWSTTSGGEIFRVDAVDDAEFVFVYALRFSPDGRYVFAMSNRGHDYLGHGVGVVYSVVEKRLVHQIPSNSADFSVDGTLLYYIDSEQNQTIQILDLLTGEASDLLSAPVSAGYLWGLTTSPSGTYVAAVNGNAQTRQTQVLVWQLASREIVQVLPVRDETERISFSRDERLLSTTGNSDIVQIWESETGRNVATLPGTAKVTGASFSADSEWLAVGDFSGSVRLFPSDRDPRGVGVYVFATGQVSAISLSADGSQLQFADWFGVPGIHVMDIDSGEELVWNKVPVTTSRAWPRGDFAFSPGGRRLAARRDDDPRTATIWDTVTGEEITSLHDHAVYVSAVAFNHNGELVATADANELRIWNATTGALVQTLPLALATVHAIAFSPDGQSIATGGDPGVSASGVSIWDLETGEARFHLGEPTSVRGLAFSPDSQKLAAADYGQAAIFVWDAVQGSSIGKVDGISAVSDVAWSPDGTRLAAIGYDANVHLFHAESLEELLVLRTLGLPTGSLGFTPCVAFSLDGSKIAANSPLGMFTIWDAGAEARYQSLDALTSAIDADPDNLLIRRTRGDIYFERQEWQNAIDDYTVLLTSEGPQDDLITRRAQAFAYLEQWDLAAADYGTLIDLLPLDRRWNSERSRYLLSLAQQQELYAALLEARPEDTHFRLVQRRHLALCERWSEAAEGLDPTVSASELETEEWFEVGCLLLIGDHTTGYQEFLNTITRDADVTDPLKAFTLARMYGLTAQTPEAAEQAVHWAESAVAADRRPWHLHALGLALYRAGRYDEAIDVLEESNSTSWGNAGKVQNGIVLAMIYHELEETSNSEEWRQRVDAWIAEITANANGGRINTQSIDWIAIHALRLQAQALIGRAAPEKLNSAPPR